MFRKMKLYPIRLVQLKDHAKRMTGAARSTLLGAALIAPGLALAGGGLDSATEGANTFKIWLYSFLGVCASCVLLWKGAECWADRSHWSEFVTLGGKVAVVGAVVGVLAPYLWNLFT
ncbi:hypothetical protein E1N52_39325 [Paraburkholderia guartelaensis]|uniref:Conjugal transfer protein n=1 Tax=Paraburkholderia guartelaensis TaxID=2546446 RepID=A0A4V2ZUY5_9BURK|nr:hypothetical protein [Paraburkholderia guartelaensis]TDG02518.1 hypothetical protein E1N52_39325 [Paraburkholderia guartelaensis]